MNSQSPAQNILVEDIYCNDSGGCAIGSLALNTSISNILYRNIYTWNSNQMMMIKSYDGSGTVENVVFENFIGKKTCNVSLTNGNEIIYYVADALLFRP